MNRRRPTSVIGPDGHPSLVGLPLLGGVMTCIAFMALDPNPSVLLALSCGANMAIVLWIVLQLIALRLLLSPVAGVVIGPGLLFSYSLGNLPARIAGDARFIAQEGTLDLYPMVAALATIGLLLFAMTIFAVFRRPVERMPIDFADLRWKPWQVVPAMLLAVFVLGSMSAAYEFTGGRFRDVGSETGKWLAASFPMFVLLPGVIGVSLLTGRAPGGGRLAGASGVLFTIACAVALRYRTFMVIALATLVFCWLTVQPERWRRVALASLLTLTVMFLAGTLVKILSRSQGSTSIVDNVRVLDEVSAEEAAQIAATALRRDQEYRVAGFEMPAAIVLALDSGASPLFGSGMAGGIVNALPAFLRPDEIGTERAQIGDAFLGKGLVYDDSIGIPLTSGLADWGMEFAPLIYIALGAYCVVLWRVAQSSPRMFLAYLLAFNGVGDLTWDLVWDDGLVVVRGIAFAWLCLFAFGRFLMPTHEKSESAPPRQLERVRRPRLFTARTAANARP